MFWRLLHVTSKLKTDQDLDTDIKLKLINHIH